jgi:hypothetical protein
MLLNKGRHPYTNETIIPEEIVEHVAYGRAVSKGKPEFPELVSAYTRFKLLDVFTYRHLSEPKSIWCWSMAVFIPRPRYH